MLTTEREKVNVVTLHEFSSLSRTASYYAGSLNDSGITKGMREIRWAHVTVSKQYREHAFRKLPSTTMDGGWIKGSFDPWQRSLFVPSVSSANTKEKGPLLAGKNLIQSCVKSSFFRTRVLQGLADVNHLFL